ncbi:hypothetical protein ACP275_10G155600 [Erythranthe tilingii]
MKKLLTCFVAYALGHALGNWTCHTLFGKPGTKKPVGSVVTADDEQELIVETTRYVSPAHFLTKIEYFSLFTKYGIDKYETMEFKVGDYKWKLIIYPNGKKGGGDHISVYLAMAQTSSLPMDWEFNAIFTIFLYDQILDNYLCFSRVCRFNETKYEWGFPEFISKENLINRSSGYLVDDNLVLGAEVFVLKRRRVVERVTLLEPLIYLTRNWKIPNFSKLRDFWISDEFPLKGFNWKMMMYPNRYFSSKDSALEVYLVCVSASTFATHQKVKATYFMRLIGRSGAIIRKCELASWFTSSNTTWGTSFTSLAENDFLVDDCCTLQVEICLQVLCNCRP